MYSTCITDLTLVQFEQDYNQLVLSIFNPIQIYLRSFVGL